MFNRNISMHLPIVGDLPRWWIISTLLQVSPLINLCIERILAHDLQPINNKPKCYRFQFNCWGLTTLVDNFHTAPGFTTNKPPKCLIETYLCICQHRIYNQTEQNEPRMLLIQSKVRNIQSQLHSGCGFTTCLNRKQGDS